MWSSGMVVVNARSEDLVVDNLTRPDIILFEGTKTASARPKGPIVSFGLVAEWIHFTLITHYEPKSVHFLG